MNISDSKNVVAAHVDANGNVIVGDGNTITVINLKEAAHYKAIQAGISSLNERFEQTKQRIQQFPDEDSFAQELLKIDKERTTKQKELESLKEDVIKLADDFARIPVNTERLRLAKQHFEGGDFQAARAVLDSAMMSTELDVLLERQAKLQKAHSELDQNLDDKANEFLILAQLTAVDYDQADRFEKTVSYYEQSLKAKRYSVNLASYAHFLHIQNQYNQALPLYEEILQRYRHLNSINPQPHKSNVAKWLNNLGSLYNSTGLFDLAEDAFNETLQIIRQLAATNPQTYLSKVATALNNLGGLYRNTSQFDLAEKAVLESLQITRQLAVENSLVYLPELATSLSNIGVIYMDSARFDLAEEAHLEALEILCQLVVNNPKLYQSSIAASLNNLGVLYTNRGLYESAEEVIQKSLQLRRDLALDNPQVHQPGVAGCLTSIGELYYRTGQLVKAEESYKEVS